MASVELSEIPAEFAAGDSLCIRHSLSDFPASDGWQVVYALAIDGAHIKWTSAADGADHVIDLDTAATASYTPARYAWQSYVKKGAERYRIADGMVTIAPNLEAATGGLDARPHCYIILDALEAAFEGRASETQTALSWKDRSISEMTHEELKQAVLDAKRSVWNYERGRRRKQGRATGSQIKVRF